MFPRTNFLLLILFMIYRSLLFSANLIPPLIPITVLRTISHFPLHSLSPSPPSLPSLPPFSTPSLPPLLTPFLSPSSLDPLPPSLITLFCLFISAPMSAYNMPPLGFIAPFLYHVYEFSPEAFNDVVLGDNVRTYTYIPISNVPYKCSQ